jgi:hypothetical protein
MEEAPTFSGTVAALGVSDNGSIELLCIKSARELWHLKLGFSSQPLFHTELSFRIDGPSVARELLRFFERTYDPKLERTYDAESDDSMIVGHFVGCPLVVTKQQDANVYRLHAARENADEDCADHLLITLVDQAALHMIDALRQVVRDLEE